LGQTDRAFGGVTIEKAGSFDVAKAAKLDDASGTQQAQCLGKAVAGEKETGGNADYCLQE